MPANTRMHNQAHPGHQILRVGWFDRGHGPLLLGGALCLACFEKILKTPALVFDVWRGDAAAS